MNMHKHKTSPFQLWYDSMQPDPEFDHTACQDDTQLRAQCDTFIGSGAGGIVLGCKANKAWVFRVSKLNKEAKDDTKSYERLTRVGKCPPNTQFLTSKQLFMQNWRHVKNTDSSCLPVVHNFVTTKCKHKVGIVMERLLSFEDHIGKKAFKNGFAHSLLRLVLAAGMVFQKNGLTSWDIKSDNICVRPGTPQQRFLVTIPALPVDMEIDIPQGFAMVMIDFDDCTSLDDSGRPCTSPALGIHDYYRPFCSVMGLCKTFFLRVLLTNDKTTRIVWRSHSLLKTMLVAATVFFPEAAPWLQLAQDALAKNDTQAMVANAALAVLNMDIVIYNYNRYKTEPVAAFVQNVVTLNNGQTSKQAFWEQFIAMLHDAKAPKIHFKHHFTVCLGRGFFEQDNSHFGLLAVQLARRLGVGVRVHIPTITKGDMPFSEASSSISVVQSDDGSF